MTPTFRSTADSSHDPETECGIAHAVEHYAAIKRNAVLTHATKWTDYENMMLIQERRQTQQAKCCTIPFP